MSSAPSRAAITELVVQGVRRFGDLKRIHFTPGYNVLYGLTSAGKTTIFDVLLSLMFASTELDEAKAFKSMLPQAATTCRAGITIVHAGGTFRVLKDYHQGTVGLSQLSADKKFELIFTDPGAIRHWLIEEAKLGVGAGFAPLFTFTRNDLPSSHEATVSAVRREGVSSVFEDRLRALPLAEKRALLVQLQDEYRRHAEVKTSEFLQDGLRSKLYEVDTVLRRRTDARKAIEEVDLEVKDIEGVPKLPDGFEARLESYRRQEKSRESDLADLVGRQADAHSQLDSVIPPPYSEKDLRAMRTPQQMIEVAVKKDFILDGGLAGVPIGLIMATFFSKPLNVVGTLLLAAGVGLVVWRGLLVLLKAKEAFDGLRKDVDTIDEQVKTIEKKWEIESTFIRNLMKAYHVEDPDEMHEIQKRRDELVAKRATLRASMEKIALPTGETDIDAAHEKITRQIESIEKRMAEIGSNFTTDPQDLEPQIERLDREVARAEGRRATSRAKLFGREEDMADAVEEGSISNVLGTWCDTRQADTGALLRAIQQAFGRNVRALSGGRYSEGIFDAEGAVSLREDGKSPIPFESLDAIGKDAAYLALRMTLLQLQVKGDGTTVALLDDPFDLDEGRLGVVARAFRALGAGSQVIHLTSRPGYSKLADQTSEI